MALYHFSLGNSNVGAVGFCAEVQADTPEDAVSLLRDALPQDTGVDVAQHQARIGYLRVYFNGDAIRASDAFCDDDEQDVPALGLANERAGIP